MLKYEIYKNEDIPMSNKMIRRHYIIISKSEKIPEFTSFWLRIEERLENITGACCFGAQVHMGL